MAWLKTRHLQDDVALIQRFLNQFGRAQNGEWPVADINATGDLVIVQNMPLPDGFKPDYIDVLLIVDKYPAMPPIGIYLLERNNAALISQLSRIFNVMNQGFHGAVTVPGYRWICFHYQGGMWKFNHRRVSAGDNLCKFLTSFYNHLESEVR